METARSPSIVGSVFAWRQYLGPSTRNRGILAAQLRERKREESREIEGTL
jgi:hypothetical protein